MGTVLVTVGNAKMVKSGWPGTVPTDTGERGASRGSCQVAMPKLTVKGEGTVETFQRSTSKNI